MEIDPEKELEAEIVLFKRIALGDRASFEELYNRFSGVLFSAAYRVLNNHEAAEDVLQDVFVQIWEKAPLYDATRGKPMTWALTLTRNKAIDRLRSAQRRNRLQEDAQKEWGDVNYFAKGGFEAVGSLEKGKLVRAALERLSPDERTPIELAFFSSATHAEIAERLGEPLGTIKARIRRGLVKLREQIGPKL